MTFHKLRPNKHAGFTLVELAVYAVIAAMIAAGALYYQASELRYQVSRAQVDQLKVLSTALGKYQGKFSTELIGGTAIPLVANPLAPTIAELKAVGVLDTSIATTSMYAGGYATTIRTTPVGCTGVNCSLFGLVYLTTPVVDAQNRVDSSALGEAISYGGGDIGASNDLDKANIRGNQGVWAVTNPLTNVSGILAARVIGDGGVYLPLDGSKAMMGSLQMGGKDIANVANVTATGTVAASALTATGAVSGATLTATGSVTGDSVTALNTVSGSNVSATNTVSGSNVSAANTVSGTNLNASNNVTAVNAVNGASVTASGTVKGATVTATGQVSGADVTASNSITAGGTVTGFNLTATNRVSGTDLIASNNITATNTVTGNNLTAANLVSGKNVQATATVSGTDVTASNNITATNRVLGSLIQATGTVMGTNVTATNLVSGSNVTASNTVLGAVVQATGTVFGFNIQATNQVSAPSVSTNTVWASGTISGRDISASNSVTAPTATVSGTTNTGNLTASNLVMGQTLQINGTATVQDLSASNSVSAPTINSSGTITASRVVATSSAAFGATTMSNGLTVSGNVAAHSGWWSMITRDGAGNDNIQAATGAGSINVNDIYIRSAGKWASQMASTPPATFTYSTLYNIPGGWNNYNFGTHKMCVVSGYQNAFNTVVGNSWNYISGSWGSNWSWSSSGHSPDFAQVTCFD